MVSYIQDLNAVLWKGAENNVLQILNKLANEGRVGMLFFKPFQDFVVLHVSPICKLFYSSELVKDSCGTVQWRNMLH